MIMHGCFPFETLSRLHDILCFDTGFYEKRVPGPKSANDFYFNSLKKIYAPTPRNQLAWGFNCVNSASS